ncbi:DUF3817 domain-containing protein [Actinokineospora auranticolor]|uniref:Integral membrane protein n=1 Tax=Actinokineospora auranticolor TaxID=155976 RepID=A0A2S6GBP0_9PSEU|nr:DUF3817 domain-containing protein [Actinokineospora auranticolor]PPK61595.1 integral membrane protein [Actinokineospora auranticolor]
MSMTDEENPAQAVAAQGVRGALARYRVMAYVVGVGLLALVVAMVLKYAADNSTPVAIVGPAHGFLYVVYLLTAFDLALKARWSVKGTLLVLVSGMIPFVSFFVERRVTRDVKAGRKL